MTKPEEPVDGAEFDLDAIAAEMRGEDVYAREGHTARTLIRTSDLRIVLVAMRAGAKIAEHRAKNTVSIHALRGHIRVTIGARAVELGAGRLVALDPGLTHDVEATEESEFLLTLGWGPR